MGHTLLPMNLYCRSALFAVFIINTRVFFFAAREENIAWNSNIIAERVSHYAVKTITGRVYILVGKMNLHVDSGE